VEVEATGAPTQRGLDKNAFAGLEEVFRCGLVAFRVREAGDLSWRVLEVGGSHVQSTSRGWLPCDDRSGHPGRRHRDVCRVPCRGHDPDC